MRLADRWATWIVVIALAAAAGTWLVTGEAIRAVTILVVFCPCALVLATPTAIMAAIGNVTRFGALVREGDALERLAKARKAAFDKTGTLTHGRPEVVAVVPCASGHGRHEGSAAAAHDEAAAPLDEAALLDYAAAAESMSEHPLGKAIVRGWKSAREAEAGRAKGPADAVDAVAPGARTSPADGAARALPRSDDFAMIPGRGVAATVAGRRVLAGNLEMMLEHGVAGALHLESAAAEHLEEGRTVVHVAVDGRAAGLVALADTIRPSARETVRAVRALGVEPVLLTGDRPQAARRIAEEGGHLGRGGRLPARRQAARHRTLRGRRDAGVHGGRRHQRRARPQTRDGRHRHGRRGQRHRRRPPPTSRSCATTSPRCPT